MIKNQAFTFGGAHATCVSAFVAWIVFGSISPLAAAQDPFEIDAILPLTGGAAYLGASESKTLSLAENVVNKSGGINGRPVHFAISDDQSNPQITVQLATGIISRHSAVVLGPSLTATCRAIAPLLKDVLVSYCFSPGVQPEAGAFMFSAALADQSVAQMQYARERGWTRIGLLTTSDATGQNSQLTMEHAVGLPENKALKLVVEEKFSPTDINVAGQMARMKQADVQMIVLGTTGGQLATALRGIVDAGLTAPTFTGGGNMIVSQLKQYDAFFPAGLYFAAESIYARDGLKPGPLRTTIDAYYQEAAAANLTVESGSALSWDGTMLVIGALRKLGTNASARQIRDYIGGLRDYVGVDGIYDFPRTPQRGIDESNAHIVHWDPKLERFTVPK